jgi:hypothetical protein
VVFIKNLTAVMLDPMIVYEKGHAIQMANQDRKLKNAHLDQAIKKNFQVGAVTYMGLVKVARGSWHFANSKNLAKLGITDPGFESHFCRSALKGTINMCRLFMDG